MKKPRPWPGFLLLFVGTAAFIYLRIKLNPYPASWIPSFLHPKVPEVSISI